MNRFQSLLLWAAAVCVAPLWGHAATNLVSGTVVADAAWSGTNLLIGTVVVQTNVAVTVNPGTYLLLSNGASLVVYGQLLANGTSNAPIYFTRQVTGQRWKQLRFVKAADSVLRHCVFEYANSAGTHLDYYDNDCNTNTPPPVRNYHEAIVALASHLDIDYCTFRYLPDNTSTAEGDALAIISDDPQTPGAASAHITNCRFLSIGQGVHTRFSYVRVEGCYFTGHHGDNDDVDLYGESVPPPLILNNIFLNPGHDDMINPTRCSAWIIGNLVAGGDDHGIVLRDKGNPVLVNNVISNCAAGGVSIQNQCDALLVNNTILDCGRGIRLFDHTGRWGAPYCLTPGSGKVTLYNTIIWDCPITFDLADSPYTGDRGSHVTVIASLVQGGQTRATVSANSTLTWGAGNLEADPLLTNGFRLRADSPAIDAGTSLQSTLTNLAIAMARDYDGWPRPLDGDGDGVAAFDIGVSEFFLASNDSNSDGIPDGWAIQYGFHPLDAGVAASNPDADAATTFEEWIADTNPTNALSFLSVQPLASAQAKGVQFVGSPNREYSLVMATNLLGNTNGGSGTLWVPVSNQTQVPGTGSAQTLLDTNAAREVYYRVQVNLR